jgi:hypothetical protein
VRWTHSFACYFMHIMFTFMHCAICDICVIVYVTCALYLVIFMTCHLVMLIYFASALYSKSNEIYFVYSCLFYIF